MNEVKIKFYGEYRIAAGMKETTIEIHMPMKVQEILKIIANLTPQLASELTLVNESNDDSDNLAIVVNDMIANYATMVLPGDELRILPPLTGGFGGN